MTGHPEAGSGQGATVRVLAPLAIRDFALLYAGMAVSLLGDGMYTVAIAWQVYALSNAPTALSVVGVAWSVPQVVLLLFTGVLSDRLDRRRLMIGADVVRGVAIGAIAALALTGAIELWHVVALVVLVGVGDAFFGPAYGAIVPDIVPPRLLVEANSLDQLVRPLAIRLVGPALGGLAVAGIGAGYAFVLDAASFAASAGAILLMRPRLAPRPEPRSVLAELREGLGFVRAHVWLWGTLLSGLVTCLAFWGPFEVLVPYLVKNELGGDAADLGLVFAAGGAGSVLVSLAMGQWGIPRLHITFMYVTWTLAVVAFCAFAGVETAWQGMAASFVIFALITAGLIAWMTLVQRLVPPELLGRVKSLEWLLTIGLVPVSFALTGPVAGAIGARPTAFWAGLAAGVLTLAAYFLPGMRDTERDGGSRVVLGRPDV